MISLGSNSNAYLPSNISFSIRDSRDRLSISLPIHDRFDHYAFALKTRSSFGLIFSLTHSKTDRSLVISLHHGRVQIHLQSYLLFDDDRTINDGQTHEISVAEMISSKTLHLRIDQRRRSLSFPDSHHYTFLFFDRLIIAGSDRFHSNQTFVGCLANLLYNNQPIIPRAMISADRLNCFSQPGAFCDDNNDHCSFVCQGQLPKDLSRKASLEYRCQLALGQDEQISFLFHPSSTNGTLMIIPDGRIQISIVLQVRVLLSFSFRTMLKVKSFTSFFSSRMDPLD